MRKWLASIILRLLPKPKQHLVYTCALGANALQSYYTAFYFELETAGAYNNKKTRGYANDNSALETLDQLVHSYDTEIVAFKGRTDPRD